MFLFRFGILFSLLSSSIRATSYFHGGSLHYKVIDVIKVCRLKLYATEIIENRNLPEIQACNLNNQDEIYHRMPITCQGCSSSEGSGKARVDITCDNWRPKENYLYDVSTMMGHTTVNVNCEGEIVFWFKGCCWSYSNTGYAFSLRIKNLKRKNGLENSSPTSFIPHVFRMNADKEDSFNLYVYDNDGDKITCHQPIVNVDCMNCDWIDNIRYKNEQLVTIHENCSITTNFKTKNENIAYRLVVAIEERDRDDHAYVLSRSTIIALLFPKSLQCPERVKISTSITPNDNKLIPGITYRLTAISENNCNQTIPLQMMFSFKPKGSRISRPKIFPNGKMEQSMEFQISQSLCQDKIPICVYLLHNGDYQSKEVCKIIECS